MQHTNHSELSQEQNQQFPFFSPESHAFNAGIATATKSINAAVIFSHLFFWLKHNKIHDINQIEGRTWMYQSIPQMALHFPYFTEKQVRDALIVLDNHGYIIKGNFHQDKMERTNWYAFKNEDWLEVSQKKSPILPTSPMHESKNVYDKTYKSDAEDVKVRCSNKDKDNKIEYNIKNKQKGEQSASPPSISIFSSKKEKKEDKILYREHVRLKPGEYESLCEQLTKDYVDHWIEALDDHIASKGAKYINHAKTIQIWHKRALKGGQLPKVGSGSESQLEGLKTRITTNRSVCNRLEDQLRKNFTSYIFIEARPEAINITNKHKDFCKEYRYTQYSPKDLRENLIKDLSICFPNVRISIQEPSENE